MLEAIYSLPCLDIAKPPGNQKKQKKPKTPSQNHSKTIEKTKKTKELAQNLSKTIEKTKKNQKNQSFHTLWGEGGGGA